MGYRAARRRELLRDDLVGLQGTAGLKLTRLAGPLNAPERMEMDAVFTPTKVRATSRHLPGRLAIDGGTVTLQNRDLLCDGVAIAMQDMSGTLSGSFRGYAAPSAALDLSIARATIGPRGASSGRKTRRVSRAAPGCRRPSRSTALAYDGPRLRRGGSMSPLRRRFRAAPARRSTCATGPAASRFVA